MFVVGLLELNFLIGFSRSSIFFFYLYY